MNTAGRKAKGRFLQNLIRDRFRNIFKDKLEDDDIKATLMGDSGTDIKLSPAARKLIPFDIESKNHKQVGIVPAMKQAEKNCKGTDRIPLLIFKQNNTPVYCVVELDKFLKLLYGSDGRDSKEETGPETTQEQTT